MKIGTCKKVRFWREVAVKVKASVANSLSPSEALSYFQSDQQVQSEEATDLDQLKPPQSFDRTDLYPLHPLLRPIRGNSINRLFDIVVAIRYSSTEP